MDNRACEVEDRDNAVSMACSYRFNHRLPDVLTRCVGSLSLENTGSQGRQMTSKRIGHLAASPGADLFWHLQQHDVDRWQIFKSFLLISSHDFGGLHAFLLSAQNSYQSHLC